jgi:hypothetical protein
MRATRLRPKAGKALPGEIYRAPTGDLPGCDWCDDDATERAERRAGRGWIGTGQWLYACPAHAEVLYKATARPEKP